MNEFFDEFIEKYFKYLVLIMSKDKNNIIGIIFNILFLTRITR